MLISVHMIAHLQKYNRATAALMSPQKQQADILEMVFIFCLKVNVIVSIYLTFTGDRLLRRAARLNFYSIIDYMDQMRPISV